MGGEVFIFFRNLKCLENQGILEWRIKKFYQGGESLLGNNLGSQSIWGVMEENDTAVRGGGAALGGEGEAAGHQT